MPDRAQFYFNGHWFDVGFDELDTLAVKGTDLVIFEKEGMAETLTALSDKLGFAILFTRGFATKYVRDLAELTAMVGNVLDRVIMMLRGYYLRVRLMLQGLE